MLSLDLFTSKFEESVRTGAVDSVMEQDQTDPQEKIPTNINQFNTDDNRALVKKIWAQISQHAVNDTAGWLTLEWPNQPAATLSRNQVWTVINKIAKMPSTQRNAFALSTLGDRNAFLTWMNGLKIITRPAPKKEPSRGQQSLDLKELDQKKSSKESPYKDVRVQRAMRQAAADYPAAGSDAEAFAKSMLDAQDQDQENISKLRQSTQRQRDLLNKNDRLDQRQQQMLGSLEKEINDVDQTNASLEKTVQQMQQANAALQRRLDQMRGKPVATPTIPVGPGVSVATDKIPPATTPAATTPAVDPRARQYAQALRKQLNQLQTMVALKAPEDQSQLKQDIDALKAQLAKLQQQEPIATATQATVGGQAADVMPAQDSADADDSVIDLTGIDNVLAQFRQPAKKSAKKKTKAKKEPEFELTPEARSVDTIPLKSVVQGYTVEYNPRTRQVTVSRRGQLVGTGINKSNSAKYHLTLINNIIDRSEEDKYPTDIDDRDVALPMRTATEGSVFGQQKFDTQMDLAKLKSELEKNKPAQSAVAMPQPVAYQPPARLSDLQLRKQRVDNLASIKQTIEQLQARATRGGRELPRGLAADLEDYFTVKDVDTAYNDMMNKYQRQLAALQQYLGMRKVLWSPKKDVHETKSSKAYEQGGREGYYGRPNRNPYDAGTEEHADYNRGYRDFRDEGKDYGVDKPKKPSSIDRDRDFLEGQDQSQPTDEVMKRLFKDFGDIFGKQPPEPKSQEPEKKEVKEMGRAGYNAMQTEKDWIEVERYLSKLINDRTLDPESRAEARQRYLEKRKEAQQKGWAK